MKNDKNKLYQQRTDLLQHRADDLDAATKAYDSGDTAAYNAAMEKVKGYNAQLETVNGLIAECEKKFPGGEPGHDPGEAFSRTAKSGTALVNSMRGSEQYANAWIKAMREGIRVDRGSGIEDLKPLYEVESAVKALTLGGGATPGEDGGFLAPMDFENKVALLLKEHVDLSTLVNTEAVNVNTGWRAVETSAARTKLRKVGEMGTIEAGAQPSFRRVVYNCEKYAEMLPVSNELLADASGLLSYLAAWWAPKLILTKNDLIISALNELDYAPLAGATAAEQMKALKTLINTGLNTAHKKRSSILANSFGYNLMDCWTDDNGRAVLVPDPKGGDFDRFKNRPVISADPDEIPDVTVGSKTYTPLYVGDFKSFGTLFLRNGTRIRSTDIGGKAWETDSTEIRVTARMDFQTVDEKAVKNSGFEVTA